MRYVGADVYHRDWAWWDRAGDWNGPDFRTTIQYLGKSGMGQLSYAFLYTVDGQSKVARVHPDWVLGSTLDMSRPEVVEFMKGQLDGFVERWGQFEWRNDSSEFEAWKAGRTGVPIVDAAMRQLKEIGWIHNRARMIAASYLVKDLLIDWRWGEAWFMENLLDGDLAANNGGWQWTAGTGTDAAPYFRIFNPVTQGQKFDPDGLYVQQWVPELANVPAKVIHGISTTTVWAHAKADTPATRDPRRIFRYRGPGICIGGSFRPEDDVDQSPHDVSAIPREKFKKTAISPVAGGTGIMLKNIHIDPIERGVEHDLFQGMRRSCGACVRIEPCRVLRRQRHHGQENRNYKHSDFGKAAGGSRFGLQVRGYQ